MPVDDDVDVVLDGCLDHDVNLALLRVGISKEGISCIEFVARAAIAVVVVDTHGVTEYVNFQVVDGPLDDFLVVVLDTGCIGPEHAHTADHGFLAVLLTHNLAAICAEGSKVLDGPYAEGFGRGCSRIGLHRAQQERACGQCLYRIANPSHKKTPLYAKKIDYVHPSRL